MKYWEWTKRLGQRHWSDGGSRTFCGMPMLGNNYARIIPDDQKKDCEKCLKAIEADKYRFVVQDKTERAEEVK